MRTQPPAPLPRASVLGRSESQPSLQEPGNSLHCRAGWCQDGSESLSAAARAQRQPIHMASRPSPSACHHHLLCGHSSRTTDTAAVETAPKQRALAQLNPWGHTRTKTPFPWVTPCDAGVPGCSLDFKHLNSAATWPCASPLTGLWWVQCPAFTAS